MPARTAVVIDDEPDVTSYLCTLLSDHAWDARPAHSVEDGLALVRSLRPAVVLLDLMMPEQGGLKVLVAIRKDPSLQDTPVVIVSGIQEKLTSDYHAYLERFRHYRADAFLDKPIDAGELLRTVDRLVPAPV